MREFILPSIGLVGKVKMATAIGMSNAGARRGRLFSCAPWFMYALFTFHRLQLYNPNESISTLSTWKVRVHQRLLEGNKCWQVSVNRTKIHILHASIIFITFLQNWSSPGTQQFRVPCSNVAMWSKGSIHQGGCLLQSCWSPADNGHETGLVHRRLSQGVPEQTGTNGL